MRRNGNPKILSFYAIFGSRKVLRKEKIIKKNDFLIFDFIMENMKENKI